MQCLLGSPSINSIHFWSNIKRSTRAPTVTICSVYFDIENRSEGVPVYRNPWIRESRMKCTTIREFVIAGRPARLDLISGKVHVEDGAHCAFTESLDISEAKAPPSKIDHSCVSQAFFLSKCALCKKKLGSGYSLPNLRFTAIHFWMAPPFANANIEYLIFAPDLLGRNETDLSDKST